MDFPAQGLLRGARQQGHEISYFSKKYARVVYWSDNLST